MGKIDVSGFTFNSGMVIRAKQCSMVWIHW